MNPHLKRSRKQEKRGAKEFDGYTNPRSGAGDWHKNDVRNEQLSIEFKTTSKKQYTLKESELLLAEKEALLSGRRMLFVVEINGREWAVQPKEDFLDYYDPDQEPLTW